MARDLPSFSKECVSVDALGLRIQQSLPLKLNCRDEIIPILRALQHVYEQTGLRTEILGLIGNDVNRHSSPDRGREGLTYWSIMVLAAVRLGCNLDYDKRGKQPDPIQYGHKVLVIEDAMGFICRYTVIANAVLEQDVLVPEMRKLQERMEGKIQRASFDRGFHTPDNQEILAQIVDHPCIPKKGQELGRKQQEEASVEFRQAAESSRDRVRHRRAVGRQWPGALPRQEQARLRTLCEPGA